MGLAAIFVKKSKTLKMDSSRFNEEASRKLMMERRGKDYFRRTSAPYDARFPNTNNTKECWQNFTDYHRCKKQKGEDYEPCNYFLKSYHSFCPGHISEKNDDLMEKSAYPTKRF